MWQCNRDDAVASARRSPSAIKHDAKERFLVPAAEERAVQPLRAWDASGELAVGRDCDIANEIAEGAVFGFDQFESTRRIELAVFIQAEFKYGRARSTSNPIRSSQHCRKLRRYERV